MGPLGLLERLPPPPIVVVDSDRSWLDWVATGLDGLLGAVIGSLISFWIAMRVLRRTLESERANAAEAQAAQLAALREESSVRAAAALLEVIAELEAWWAVPAGMPGYGARLDLHSCYADLRRANMATGGLLTSEVARKRLDNLVTLAQARARHDDLSSSPMSDQQRDTELMLFLAYEAYVRATLHSVVRGEVLPEEVPPPRLVNVTPDSFWPPADDLTYPDGGERPEA